MLPEWSSVRVIIFDFDGVFTNNKVFVDQSGNEFVCCDRSDGLAFDLFRSFCNLKSWHPKLFILSSESNTVVSARAHKLNIKCHQAVGDKCEFVSCYLDSQNISPESVVYLGNDLNDLGVMGLVGFSVAPQDSHPVILSAASLVLPCNGGDGFVRLFIESLIGFSGMDHAMIT